MSDELVRAFVAIPLPEHCVTQLQNLQNHLRELMPRSAHNAVRWVRPHQMHLTLKFLGDVPADEIEEITVALRNACAGCTSFSLALSGTGCFPNCRKPRVLWAGINGQTEPLLQLQSRVEQALVPYGERQEARAFRPHLTLARIQTRDLCMARRVDDVVAQSEYSINGEWQVKQVLLIQSRLSPGGSQYSELVSIEL